MALEDLTGTKYIDALVSTNPPGTDGLDETDDHIRGIKNVLKKTFPNLAGAVTGTSSELNKLDGATVSTTELNILDGVTATTAELNILDGVTSTTAELNILDGVTSTAAEINLLDGLAGKLAVMATGTYTGNGATSLAITGVGFQVKYLRIWVRETVDTTERTIFETCDVVVDDNAAGGAWQHVTATNGGGAEFRTDAIIALGADGFTVDDAGVDGHPNQNTVVYNFLAMGVV